MIPCFRESMHSLFFSQGNNSVCLLIQVNAKLRLPVVLHKFLQPVTLTPEEFFPQWKAWTVQSLKLQEVVSSSLYYGLLPLFQNIVHKDLS
jgi:hypothetical protein